MDTKSKLDALKSAFDKKTTNEGGGGNSNWKLFYKFWSMPTDATATVRFLPDLDENNSLGFLVENLHHELIVNGEKKYIPCLAMHGEDCPICATSRKYYDEKDELNGKKYYRKKSYIGQIIVVESPIEHDQNQLVKLIEFGPAVFKQIQAAFKSGDLEMPPQELKGGYNFRIRKTMDGKYASYSTSSFATKASDLDDDVIEKLSLLNLSDYRGAKMERSAVDALLTAEMTGASIPQPSREVPQASVPAPTSAAPSTPTVAPTAPASSGMSALEQLRARAKAQAAS